MSTPVLLHLDGSNGSSTFTNDNGSGPTFSQIAAGVALLTTTGPVFGTACLAAGNNGSGGGIKGSASVTFTGEFAFEERFLTINNAFAGYVMGVGDNSGSTAFNVYRDFTGTGVLTINFLGTTASTGNVISSNNTWFALGVFRDASNVVRLTVDGVVVASFTKAGTVSGIPVIGNAQFGAGFNNESPYGSKYDEVRILQDESPYSSFPYTVATSPFTFSGGSDVTVALTGVSATGAVGTVAPAIDKALTGNAGTGAVGTVSPGTAAALTGNAATGAVGTLAPGVDLALSGVSATGDVGNVGASSGGDVTIALSGVEAIGSVGSLAPSVDLALSGVAAAGSVGTLTPGVDAALSGVAGTGSVGDLVPGIDAALSGVSGTGGVGSVTVQASGDVTVALTGVQAVGQVGSVTPSGGDLPPPATGGAEYEISGSAEPRRRREGYVKPWLQRVLDAKYPRVRPVADRAQKRARVIEVQAAQMVLDDAPGLDMQALLARWQAFQPVLPPAVDPMAVFLAQVQFRLQQQAQAEEIERRLAAIHRRRQEDEAILALLLA